MLLLRVCLITLSLRSLITVEASLLQIAGKMIIPTWQGNRSFDGRTGIASTCSTPLIHAGVGYKLENELAEHGIHTVADLATAGKVRLVQLQGERVGTFLHLASMGQVQASAALPQATMESGPFTTAVPRGP